MTFQVKKGSAPSPWKAMAEAEQAASGSEIPVGVVHRDQRNPGEGAEQLVLLRPQAFAALLRAVVTLGDQPYDSTDPWGVVEGHHHADYDL